MRTAWGAAILVVACGDVGPEAMGSDSSADTGGGTTSSSTTGSSLSTSSSGDATGGVTSDTIGSSSDGVVDGTTGTDAGTTLAGSDGETSTSTSTSSSGEDTGAAECHPIMAEIAYRVSGGDGNNEWVKLYNPCGGSIDLAEYSLGYGGNDYAAGTHPLSGVIEPDTCLLFGGPNTGPQNWFPLFDVDEDLNPDLQDGGADADAIGLFALPENLIENTSIPVDAVVYGDANTNAFVGADGVAVGMPHAPTGDDFHTLYRVTIAPAQWDLQVAPQPNFCQF